MYIVDWMRVNDTVRGDWFANTTVAGQEIVAATQWLNPQGPWSVVNKTLLPPSGNIHDYYSLSPYWWPDCSNVHNTTALTEQQISDQCNYVVRDGQFNPDRTIVNDTGAFATLR
ncbi:hypothetical protein FRB95_006780 [Tulasnella sp. JGI-2019a]|nr:hypothetical protein FRB95_006780 [Tulasnella sp. JGI-2019a]